MTYRCFNVEIADNIAHLQMKRGDELNTMVAEFWKELPSIVEEIDEQAKARVIVISSTGKHFTAGMDLAAFGTGSSIGTTRTTKERGRAGANLRFHAMDLQDSFNVLERARMPVLVAIQGGCVGGGVDLTSACDCRYATEDAFFVVQEINIGMTADVGTFPRLCNLLPQGVVRELAYSGRRLSAKKAQELGLVNEIFPTQDAMMKHVMAVAKEIAEKSPLAVYGSKVMINYARDHSVPDGLDYIATWQSGMYNPETDRRSSTICCR
jgi:enoyl-CoA hydratase